MKSRQHRHSFGFILLSVISHNSLFFQVFSHSPLKPTIFIYLSVYLSVCLSIYLSIYLSTCLPTYLRTYFPSTAKRTPFLLQNNLVLYSGSGFFFIFFIFLAFFFFLQYYSVCIFPSFLLVFHDFNFTKYMWDPDEFLHHERVYKT